MSWMRAAAMVTLCGAWLGCAPEDRRVDSVTRALPGDPCWPDCPTPTTVSNVTVSGREVFDDWRDYGRFHLRKTATGASGTHYSLAANPGSNRLGLLDATVVIYEVDTGTGPYCTAREQVGTATAGADGSWSVTLSIHDDCDDGEAAGTVRIAVETRLGFCNSNRCFYIVDPDTGASNEEMSVWSRWHTTASTSSPKTVSTGQSISVGTLAFEDTTARDNDEREVAGWAFASMVDTTRKFHSDNNWPFYLDEFGPVYLRYHGTEPAHALGPRTIELGDGELNRGWTPLHEYGHVLMARLTEQVTDFVWGPYTLGPPCGTHLNGNVITDCSTWDRNGQFEYSSKSFKEGFADFAGHIALDNVGVAGATPPEFQIGCSMPDWDRNVLLESEEICPNDNFGRQIIFDCDGQGATCHGAGYATNVARALCDWHDENSDGLDQLGHTLDKMHATLRDAYTWIGADKLQTENYGFGICDFWRYHLKKEFPAESVTAHSNVLLNNGITCEL